MNNSILNRLILALTFCLLGTVNVFAQNLTVNGVAIPEDNDNDDIVPRLAISQLESLNVSLNNGGAMPILMRAVNNESVSFPVSSIGDMRLIEVQGIGTDRKIAIDNTQTIADTTFVNEKLSFSWLPRVGDADPADAISPESYRITLTYQDNTGTIEDKPFTFIVAIDAQPVPTLSQWGLLIFGLSLATFSLVLLYNKMYRPTLA